MLIAAATRLREHVRVVTLCGQTWPGCMTRPATGNHSLTHTLPTREYSTEGAARLRPQDKEVLYKGRFMLPFRVLVRLKIFQLGGVAVFAASIGTFLSEKAGANTSATFSLSSLMLVFGDDKLKQLGKHESTTTYGKIASAEWSGALPKDNVIALADVVPPLQGLSGEALKEIAEQALIPLQVDSDRQYYISLRHGILIDEARLFEILKGQYRG